MKFGKGGQSPGIFGSHLYNLQNDDPFKSKLLGILENKQFRCEERLKRLKISFSDFDKWKENCQRWFFTHLLPSIISQNLMNLQELNNSLIIFGRKLYEYECLHQFAGQGDNILYGQNNNLQKVTIDQVIKYDEMLNLGGSIWNPNNYPSNFQRDELQKYHNQLRNNIEKRKELDSFFEIEGYQIYEIRLVVCIILL